jgi:hypothetical protein
MKSTPTLVVLSRSSAGMAAAMAFVLALSGSVARAEDIGVSNSASTSTPVSPVEEFSQQLEDFQKAVPDLRQHAARCRIGQRSGIAARRQRLQQSGELCARAVELLARMLSLILNPAPSLDEELAFLRFEARVL